MKKPTRKEQRENAMRAAAWRLDRLELLSAQIETSGTASGDVGRQLMDLLRDVADGYLNRRDLRAVIYGGDW